MVIFVLLASGTLYDPPRVLNHLVGSDATSIGLKIKAKLPAFN
jgi:hypothetical protein